MAVDSTTDEEAEAMSWVPLTELGQAESEGEAESESKKEVNKMATISKLDAYKLAKKAGARFSKDSDEQSPSTMVEIAALAKLAGYRKPKTASGSTGRYFFNYLNRLRVKRGWK